MVTFQQTSIFYQVPPFESKHNIMKRTVFCMFCWIIHNEHIYFKYKQTHEHIHQIVNLRHYLLQLMIPQFSVFCWSHSAVDKCSHTVTVCTVGGKQLSVTLMHAKYGYANSAALNLVLTFTSIHTKHKLSSHTVHMKYTYWLQVHEIERI